MELFITLLNFKLMKNKNFTNNPRCAVIAYAEPSYGGVALSYVFPSHTEENAKTISKFVLVEDGEPLYKAACGAMVGDEAEVDEDGMLVQILSQPLWKRLKNYWFLFKNRRNHKKNTL